MSLNLYKSYKYANPYDTNWSYLENMTEFLMKHLEKINWEENEYIHITLKNIPWASVNEKYARISVKYFISDLNSDIRRL